MAPDEEGAAPVPGALSPGEAFKRLGNETRVAVLQALGEAEGALSFSELRDAVGMRDPGQFNYHLDQLTGHFITRTDEGYELASPGQRVVRAVVSGAVTADPSLEPTILDVPCNYCGAPIEIAYVNARLEVYCTSCQGSFGEEMQTRRDRETGGFIGTLSLPPAGTVGRSPRELYSAARVWGALDWVAAARGICRECSAAATFTTTVCEHHEIGPDGVCETCGLRYAVLVSEECTNCSQDWRGVAPVWLFFQADVWAFLLANDVDFFDREDNPWATVEITEEIRDSDPLEAAYTFAVGEESITAVVGPELDVRAVE